MRIIVILPHIISKTIIKLFIRMKNCIIIRFGSDKCGEYQCSRQSEMGCVMAGMNVSKYTITGFDSRIGFHAGVKAELGLSQDANGSGAYMDFAALLTLKGAKIDGGSLASIKFNPYYLEVPVRVGYKYAVNDDFSLFGSVGPYMAVGLFGKAKLKVDGDIADIAELGGNSMSEDIFGDDGLKRFDFGLGLKAGVEFSKKYQVAISYDFRTC